MRCGRSAASCRSASEGAGRSSVRKRLASLPGLQSSSQLAAESDSELRVHVSQVPLDCPRAEEHASPNLRVGEPVAGQFCDLALLRGELIRRLGALRTTFLAG